MSIRPTLQRGITLIEQIIFIIIISVGVVGLVSVMNPMVRHSADPMLTKQLAVIADSLLNEVMHQPFSWCDPDDAAAMTALSYADCANPQNLTVAVPSGESRYGSNPGTAFDNVADYGGFGMNDINDAAGDNAMSGFRADVAVLQSGTALGLADNSAALTVTFTVSRGRESFSSTGYRFRYAPRI